MTFEEVTYRDILCNCCAVDDTAISLALCYYSGAYDPFPVDGPPAQTEAQLGDLNCARYDNASVTYTALFRDVGYNVDPDGNSQIYNFFERNTNISYTESFINTGLMDYLNNEANYNYTDPANPGPSPFNYTGTVQEDRLQYQNITYGTPTSNTTERLIVLDSSETTTFAGTTGTHVQTVTTTSYDPVTGASTPSNGSANYTFDVVSISESVQNGALDSNVRFNNEDTDYDPLSGTGNGGARFTLAITNITLVNNTLPGGVALSPPSSSIGGGGYDLGADTTTSNLTATPSTLSQTTTNDRYDTTSTGPGDLIYDETTQNDNSVITVGRLIPNKFQLSSSPDTAGNQALTFDVNTDNQGTVTNLGTFSLTTNDTTPADGNRYSPVQDIAVAAESCLTVTNTNEGTRTLTVTRYS